MTDQNPITEESPIGAHNINTFSWTAQNPFGESAPYLLLTPGDEEAVVELRAAALQLGLQPIGFGGDIPWVGTDFLAVALRGPIADLWSGDHSWLKLRVSDAWTGDAIGRRYIVLAAGTELSGEEMSSEEIAQYLQGDVSAGLVKIRLRITND